MKITMVLLISLILVSCGSAGQSLVEVIEAEDQKIEGINESVCARVQLDGMFTGVHGVYSKKVWPEGADEPDC